MAKTVKYHRSGWKDVTMHVVNENEDGTVDLSPTEGGTPVVTSCKIADEPADGVATLGDKTLIATESAASAKSEPPTKGKASSKQSGSKKN